MWHGKRGGVEQGREAIAKAVDMLATEATNHLLKLKELLDLEGRGKNLLPIDRTLISRVVVDLEKVKGIAYGYERMDGNAIVLDDDELRRHIAKRRSDMGLE